MLELPIYNCSGAQVGTYELDPEEIAATISKQLLHDAVVMYQSNQRQGTAKTKTRGEVSGSTKKMYRQKGTGNARAGSKRSGVRRGGGHIHAKMPRDWRLKMPRKALQTATRMALRAKLDSDSVMILDDVRFDAPKTKDFVAILNALSVSDTRVLFTIPGYDVNVYKSGRNVPKVTVLPVSDINALEILLPKKIVITKAALDAFRGKIASRKPETTESVERA
ncbi:MAG: 50S ribosomal protein L4 [Planctomycetia bacterium]|nr:50S ribosomal protein L4 [Planctomycetia bacterium]